MNCTVANTTQYGFVMMISIILLALQIIILGKEKSSANCHVKKPLIY